MLRVKWAVKKQKIVTLNNKVYGSLWIGDIVMASKELFCCCFFSIYVRKENSFSIISEFLFFQLQKHPEGRETEGIVTKNST